MKTKKRRCRNCRRLERINELLREGSKKIAAVNRYWLDAVHKLSGGRRA